MPGTHQTGNCRKIQVKGRYVRNLFKGFSVQERMLT